MGLFLGMVDEVMSLFKSLVSISAHDCDFASVVVD